MNIVTNFKLLLKHFWRNVVGRLFSYGPQHFFEDCCWYSFVSVACMWFLLQVIVSYLIFFSPFSDFFNMLALSVPTRTSGYILVLMVFILFAWFVVVIEIMLIFLYKDFMTYRNTSVSICLQIMGLVLFNAFRIRKLLTILTD